MFTFFAILNWWLSSACKFFDCIKCQYTNEFNTVFYQSDNWISFQWRNKTESDWNFTITKKQKKTNTQHSQALWWNLRIMSLRHMNHLTFWENNQQCSTTDLFIVLWILLLFSPFECWMLFCIGWKCDLEKRIWQKNKNN